MTGLGFRCALRCAASTALVAGSLVLAGAIPASATSIDAAPLQEIVGGSTGLDSVDMVAVGATGSIFVVNSGAGTEALDTFAAAATGNLAPTRSITNSSNSLVGPLSLAVDGSDNAYVGNCTQDATASVSMFDHATPGGAQPATRKLVGAQTGLRCPIAAVVRGADLYVADTGAGDLDPSVRVFKAADANNKAPTTILTSATFPSPTGLAVDGSGNVYVSDGTAASVSVFASGTSTPARTIVGASTGLSSPQGLAVSASGLLFVANGGNDSVTVYAHDATGNAPPIATLKGASTHLAAPRGLALNAAGTSLVVSNQTTSSLTVYDASFAAPTSPAPSLTGVSPTSGPVAGGTTVTLTGTGFVTGATVTIGGADASASFVSSTHLTATTPAHAVGAADVVVTNPDSQVDTLVAGFTYVVVQPPGKPTGVSAVAGDGEATVDWSAPVSDGGAAITGYEVSASFDPSTFEVHTCATAGALECTVTGLTNGTPYTFTVVAANSAGPGAASLASAAVVPKGAPAAPTNVRATRGDTTVTVAWDAAADNGDAVTGYAVTADPDGATCATTGALSCTVTGLVNGIPYTFTVTATNGLGTGPASGAVGPMTPATVPQAPTGVAASAGASSVGVTWTAPADNGGTAVTGYAATANPGGAHCTTTGALSCVVLGLTNGAAYTFTVTATNAVGTGPSSAASDPATPLDRPGRPTNVVAVRGKARATVTWHAPSANGRPITSYRVTSSPGGRSCTLLTPAVPTCVVLGLTNGTAYRFVVVATNAIGTSLPSLASAAVVPAAVPSAPRSVRASFPRARVSVLIWAAPVDRGGLAITRYEYRVSATAGRTWGRWVRGTSRPTVAVAGLVKSRLYRVQVRAVNAVGAGASATASIRPTR